MKFSTFLTACLIYVAFVGSLCAVDAYQKAKVTLPKNVEFHTVLLRYSGDTCTDDGAKNVLNLLGGGCVYTYPDSHVPILVSKNKVKELQQQLGNQMSLLSD